MSEKLTKIALKDEISKRIEWYEDFYEFSPNMPISAVKSFYPNNEKMILKFGGYLELLEMRYQIELDIKI